jgi:hypothetical protein
MSYPHVTQFDEIALREALRRRVAFEIEATRGRSMWGEARPAKPTRLRFRLRVWRPADCV